MKIMLVTESFGPKGFGVSEVLSQLVRLYKHNGISVKILSPFIEDPEHLLSLGHYAVVPHIDKKFLWHPRQRAFFEREIASFKPDLIHVHGVFTLIQRSTVVAANKARVPTLLSSHGMLNPWSWQQGNHIYASLKWLYWSMVMNPILRKIDCVHAITQIEADYLALEFPGIPHILIPNAIEMNLIPDLPKNRSPEKKIVFLGRLHPKKGVDLLVQAFANNHFDREWRLVIAGPDFDPAYGQMLKRLVEQLGLTDQVSFTGRVYGRDKYALLAAAWAVAVPSYSEAIALVNIEAAAVQTPTITTSDTGLKDWAESGGVLIDADVNQLTQALHWVSQWSLKERLARGIQARTFVQERYSWQAIGPRWIQAYKDIATNGDNFFNSNL